MIGKIMLKWIPVFLAVGLYAQDKTVYSGRIIDGEENEALVGVQIIEQPGIGTITDLEGNFSLELPAGNHTLTVSYLGYENQILEVSPKNTNLGTVKMTVSQTTLNEIIISASQQQFKKSIKGSNYRLTPRTIKNLNPLNTEEVLRTVPGVNIIGDMGLSNRPNISIRGSWGRRSKKVLLMEDGSPAAPAPYIAPGAYYNPVSDRLASIEVYKGADMLRYGPNNMYGGINYITAMPPQTPEMRIKLSGGQRNYTTALLSYGGTWNNLGALVEGVYKKFDGFTDNSSVDVLNLNAKFFARLNKDQSLYFKVSSQFEDNQASLSSMTPFTYEQDPTENPFDADQFTMRRYGVDIIHKWTPKKNISLTSKVYASDFERDWWKQNTTKIKASEVESYVGQDIYNQYYSYLNGLSFTDNDIVRVGSLNNGLASNTDSRWIFTVSGWKETLNFDWQTGEHKHKLEIGTKLHREKYIDRSLANEGSKWARHGDITKDLSYELWSVSGYVRNAFQFYNWGITPIVRFEYVDMFKQDVLALANNPTVTSLEDGRQYNDYSVLLPGITIDRPLGESEVFGSIYRGFIAPSKIFGFLVEQNGVITNPLEGQNVNMTPETSINTELGWRGSFMNNRIDGQVTYFNNTISNFYAGGRNEVFEELGKINMQGLEIGLSSTIYSKFSHNLKIYSNATILDSRIVNGKLSDNDLFSEVIHSDATRDEFLQKVNSNRDAYEVYVLDANNEEQLLTDEIIDAGDFDNITKSKIIFGDNGLSDIDVPYTPPLNLTVGIDYKYKKLSAGVSTHYVAEQYTEFNNFEAESADGAIGKLPAFQTYDVYINYDFKLKEKMHVNVFVNGKNVTNQIYKASRLNRATSGIFAGGFRQIVTGFTVRF